MNMNQSLSQISLSPFAAHLEAFTSAHTEENDLAIHSRSTIELPSPFQKPVFLHDNDVLDIVQNNTFTSSAQLFRATGSTRTELVFIEGNVADYQQLIAGIDAGKEIHLLDPNQDGLQQIAQILAGRSQIDALHIISHGSNSNINLGSLTLNKQNLSEHQQDLQTISKALAKDADILLYGCNIAEQDDQHFLDTLSIATGADIAASSNLTGSSAAGADWDLEIHHGTIESAVVVNSQLAALYSQVLNIASATVTFTGTSGNIANYGSLSNASTDFLYNINGNSNYQLKIDGATKGVFEYSNPGYYVLLDANASNETSVTFSFKDNNVFTANSLKIANYAGGFASQTLAFKGYDASNNQIGSTQQIILAAGVSPFSQINFAGLTNITRLVLTANGTNGNLLHYLAIDDFALSNIKAPVTPPTVTKVMQSSGDGYYNVNNSQPVLIEVTFDQAVTVNTGGGTPQLQLETGITDQYANYVSGSGTSV